MQFIIGLSTSILRGGQLGNKLRDIWGSGVLSFLSTVINIKSTVA